MAGVKLSLRWLVAVLSDGVNRSLIVLCSLLVVLSLAVYTLRTGCTVIIRMSRAVTD